MGRFVLLFWPFWTSVWAVKDMSKIFGPFWFLAVLVIFLVEMYWYRPIFTVYHSRSYDYTHHEPLSCYLQCQHL